MTRHDKGGGDYVMNDIMLRKIDRQKEMTILPFLPHFVHVLLKRCSCHMSLSSSCRVTYAQYCMVNLRTEKDTIVLEIKDTFCACARCIGSKKHALNCTQMSIFLYK